MNGDLLSTIPHPRLAEVLARVDSADPAAAIKADMAGFCHAGNGAGDAFHGYGVIGRGRSRQEAARNWIKGAREVLGHGR